MLEKKKGVSSLQVLVSHSDAKHNGTSIGEKADLSKKLMVQDIS